MARRKTRRAEAADGAGPTHYLKMKATERDGSGWSRVGSAWAKPNGLYSIKLNRGIVLDWHDFERRYSEGAEFVLILVPVD